MSDAIKERTVSITAELPVSHVERLDTVVGQGLYPSVDAILHDAMAEWLTRHDAETTRLKQLCDEGRASGSAGPLDMDRILLELKADVPARTRA